MNRTNKVLQSIIETWSKLNHQNISILKYEVKKFHNKDNLFFNIKWIECLKVIYGNNILIIKKSVSKSSNLAIPFFLINDHFFQKYLVCLPITPITNINEKYILETLNEVGSILIKSKLIKDIIYKDNLSKISNNNQFYFHDIPLVENLLKIKGKYSSRVNRDLKKLKKYNYSVTIEKLKNYNLNLFYNLYINNNKKFGSPSLPLSFFKNLLKILDKNNMLFICYKGNLPVSCSLFIYDNDCAYYSYVGVASNQKHETGHRLIIDKAIDFFKQKKIKKINLGKSSKEQKGLIEFKNSFGSKLRSISYYSHQDRNYSLISKRSLYLAFIKFINKSLPRPIYSLFSKVQILFLGLQ